MKIFDIDKEPTAFTTRGDVDQIVHSYLPDEVWIRAEPYRKHQNTEGQCRFLNYGYYHDGNRKQVDEVIQFNNVGDNVGRFFQNYKINIDCDKETYNINSQNVHYRRNKEMPPMEWWYQGKKQVNIRRAVDKCFDKYL